MSQGVAFLIWLLCVGISAVLIGYFLKNSLEPLVREGFSVKMCPSGTNAFVTDSGETQCCNGDVVDGYCTGNLRCTLSPKSKSRLPTCTDLAASDAAAAGANKCPASMPHYFGSCTTIEGCSASTPTANGLQPSLPLEPQCILYKTRAEDMVKLDSCYNVTQAVIRDAQCSAAQKAASLPGCMAAVNAASASVPVAGAPVVCPAPPPPPSFVMTGAWIGSRIAIQKKHILANGNIVYAIQQGEYVKLVATDANNITLAAKYYVGSINDLNIRASDMGKVAAMSDAAGNYLLSTAP